MRSPRSAPLPRASGQCSGGGRAGRDLRRLKGVVLTFVVLESERSISSMTDENDALSSIIEHMAHITKTLICFDGEEVKITVKPATLKEAENRSFEFKREAEFVQLKKNGYMAHIEDGKDWIDIFAFELKEVE